MASFQGSKKPLTATTVFFGANDAALAGTTSERQHVPVEEYKDDLRRIVHHLKVEILHSICYVEILMSNIWFPYCLSTKKKKKRFPCFKFHISLVYCMFRCP